jgi:hypothetical protein
MLLRFNPVLENNYVAFLELLGIRLQPPRPSRTDINFLFKRCDYLKLTRFPPGLEASTIRTETNRSYYF